MLSLVSRSESVICVPRVPPVYSGAGGRRTPEANAAAFRTMAPLIRKHRPGARGAVLALLAFLTGEALLLASRVRRLAYS